MSMDIFLVLSTCRRRLHYHDNKRKNLPEYDCVFSPDIFCNFADNVQ